MKSWFFACLAVVGFVPASNADMITFGGLIIQSTQDGTGPAANNPALNAIQDGEAYVATLDFTGSAVSSIHAPGLYDLTGGSLVFNDPTAAATETSFGAITLVISQAGGFDDLSLLACLTTGSDCTTGNQLTASFQIPASMLNSANVPTVGLDQPHPLDLLEDDGVTDIHGSITAYSYNPPGGTSTVPEPSSLLLACTGVFAASFFLTCGPRQVPKKHPENN